MSGARKDTIGLGPGTYPQPIGPRLSLKERDARWARVRSLMKRDGLDAVIAFGNTSGWDQGSSSSRYLTSIGGNCAQVSVIFPLNGPVTAITGPVPTPEFWLKFQDWVSDVRTSFFNATPVMIERLRELGLDSSRIGIAALAGVARVPDGLVSHGAYKALEEQLPHATFVNATHLMDEVRFTKSDEEIAMLKQSVALVEGAWDVLEREAKPGVPECVVYGRMMGWLLEQGCEPTSLLLWAAGDPLPPAVSTLPSQRPLGPRDLIMIELDAKWCGYLGHGAITKWVGEPDDVAHEIAALQHRAFLRCLEAMKPGVPMGALVEICAAVASGTPYQCKPIIHSRGLGNDAPVLVFHARDERTANWLVEENAVFVVKPVVSLSDGSRKVMWGDSVVVKAEGAQRLGARPAPLVAVS